MIVDIATRLAAATICLSAAACASVAGAPEPVTLGSCEQDPSESGVYRPRTQPLAGVVTSREREEIFHRDDSGDLVAVALGDGEELWRRPAGPTPWWLAGDRLFALDGVDDLYLEAVELTREGASAGRTVVLEFPPGVRPEATTLGTTFGFSVRRASGIATVRWWASRRVATGARERPGVGAGPETASGRFTVDEDTLRVADACGDFDRQGTEPGGVSERYWTGDAWETRAFRVEDGLFSLGAENDGEPGLYLVRHDAAGESVSRLGDDPNAWRRLSGDGRSMLIRAAEPGVWRAVPVASPDAAVEFELTETLVDAELVGTTLVVLAESAVSPFGDTHRGMLPRALVAFDAATGEQRWRLATRARQVLPIPN